MKRTLCIALGLCLAAFALAEETEERSAEALEILKKADTAIKAVDSVRYTAKANPTGIAENFVSPAEGETVLIGWNGSLPDKFYVHVKTKQPESGEALELTGGGDGDTFFIIDHQEKKAYEDMDPAVMGSGGRALQGLYVIEFVHDAPFDDELNAEKVTLEGEEEVEGEACYKINVVYSGGQGESTWFFSKKDFLPRRRDQRFSMPQGDGAIQRTITRLEVDPKVEPSLFKLQLPDGYEQIDDFAP